MMRWLYISGVLLLLGSTGLNAQQHSIYSQYIFNLYAINPGYAGEREGLATGLSYRAQWVGIDGAPQTADFYAHSPLKNPRMALGLQVRNDRIGARTNTSFNATYAYKIQLSKRSKISFGLSAGMANHQYRWHELDYPGGSEPIAAESEDNLWTPTVDFGMLFLSEGTYVGLSVIGLDGGRLLDSELSDARTERFLNLVAGKIFELNENFAVKPSVLLRKSSEIWQFDAGFGARFYNALWLTGTYRYEFGPVFSAHYFVNERFHFGYAFDLPTNDLITVQSGTHEIFIGFDLNYYPKRAASPRRF